MTGQMDADADDLVEDSSHQTHLKDLQEMRIQIAMR